MIKNANKVSNYNFKPEEGLNQYIGFMSFRHFRGEKLYSDSIVRPENNYTETELFECYPVPKMWRKMAENRRIILIQQLCISVYCGRNLNRSVGGI